MLIYVNALTALCFNKCCINHMLIFVFVSVTHLKGVFEREMTQVSHCTSADVV